MQLEAVRMICKTLFCGNSDQTQTIFDVGAVDVLLRLLASSSSVEIAKQSLQGIWRFSKKHKNKTNIHHLLNAGLVPALLSHLNNSEIAVSCIRLLLICMCLMCCFSPVCSIWQPDFVFAVAETITDTISNVGAGYPQLDLALVEQFLSVLNKLLDYKDTHGVVACVVAGLCALSNDFKDHMDAMIASGVISKVAMTINN